MAPRTSTSESSALRIAFLAASAWGGREREEDLGVNQRLGHRRLDRPGDREDGLHPQARGRAAELHELASEDVAPRLGFGQERLDAPARNPPRVADPDRLRGQEHREPGDVDLLRGELVLALADPAALQADDQRRRVAPRAVPDRQAIEDPAAGDFRRLLGLGAVSRVRPQRPRHGAEARDLRRALEVFDLAGRRLRLRGRLGGVARLLERLRHLDAIGADHPGRRRAIADRVLLGEAIAVREVDHRRGPAGRLRVGGLGEGRLVGSRGRRRGRRGRAARRGGLGERQGGEAEQAKPEREGPGHPHG